MKVNIDLRKIFNLYPPAEMYVSKTKFGHCKAEGCNEQRRNGAIHSAYCEKHAYKKIMA